MNVQAFAGKNSEEFQKHYKAVKFCIENGLSYPKETSEFFKGKVGGDDLEDIQPSSILKYIENGVEIPLKTTGDNCNLIMTSAVCSARMPLVKVTLVFNFYRFC